MKSIDDADNQLRIGKAFALLTSVRDGGARDADLIRAIKYVERLHNKVTPTPRVGNPRGSWAADDIH